MTTKGKAQAETEAAEPAEEPTKAEEQAAKCGASHYLPTLAHIFCTEPAQDPDRAPGTPDHQHRHQDGDAIYLW